jgi:hypothetical protein
MRIFRFMLISVLILVVAAAADFLVSSRYAWAVNASPAYIPIGVAMGLSSAWFVDTNGNRIIGCTFAQMSGQNQNTPNKVQCLSTPIP